MARTRKTPVPVAEPEEPPKRKPGRPPKLDGGRRHEIWMDTPTREAALVLGDGSFSEGVRRAFALLAEHGLTS
jgi:hypothetical protein